MDIKKYLELKKSSIDKEIEKIVPKKINQEWIEYAVGKADYAYEPESLNFGLSKPIWDLIERGGKRWRPALTILCCEAVGGTEKQALPFTPLPELVHDGTLVADDIEDSSKERRGKKALHLIYGEDIAINAASALYFLPLSVLYKNTQKLGEKIKNSLFDLYGEEMVRVSLGQAMDISWHRGVKENITEKEYLQMCVYKTGVLARMSAKLGAIVGEGTKEQIETLGKFGESLGVGFQIKDDILNIKPESDKWGKSIGEDITEGKKTLILIKALEELKNGEKKELEQLIKGKVKEKEKIERAIELIEKTNAIQYAEKKAFEIVSNAWNNTEKVLEESEAKSLLKEFAQYCIKRKI